MKVYIVFSCDGNIDGIYKDKKDAEKNIDDHKDPLGNSSFDYWFREYDVISKQKTITNEQHEAHVRNCDLANINLIEDLNGY